MYRSVPRCYCEISGIEMLFRECTLFSLGTMRHVCFHVFWRKCGVCGDMLYKLTEKYITVCKQQKCKMYESWNANNIEQLQRAIATKNCRDRLQRAIAAKNCRDRLHSNSVVVQMRLGPERGALILAHGPVSTLFLLLLPTCDKNQRKWTADKLWYCNVL